MMSLPEPKLRLVYVTPEMLVKSAQFNNCLQTMYSRDTIARFVIDEAHCVSQWGHDFRPDYKQLNLLKIKYPKIPIMALTATANQKVQCKSSIQLTVNIGSSGYYFCSSNS